LGAQRDVGHASPGMSDLPLSLQRLFEDVGSFPGARLAPGQPSR
jgi:hypothetical protein